MTMIRSAGCAQASAGKGSVLPVAAIGDDVAALAKPPGDDGKAGADKQAVHDIGAGGRPRVRGKRYQQRHAAAHETHRCWHWPITRTRQPGFSSKMTRIR